MLCLDLYIDFVSLLPVLTLSCGSDTGLDIANSIDEARPSWTVGGSRDGAMAQCRVIGA